VTRNDRVSLPDVASDRPHPLGTAAVAIVALSAGLASAYGLRDGCTTTPEANVARAPAAGTTTRSAVADRTRSSGPTADRHPDARRAATAGVRAASTRAAAAPPTPAVQNAPIASVRTETPTPAGAAVAVQPAPGAESSGASPEPPPAAQTPDPVATASAPARLDRGYVAYLRCDGVPQIEGPFPCPRDLALERRVWKALSELERCPLTPQQRGPTDLRIEFVRTRRVEWLVASGGLDPDTVSRCVGSVLSGVGTSLRPTRMIVSFRFALL